MIEELGRILISVLLLGFAGYLFFAGFKAPEVSTALGAGAMAGTIIGAIVMYWLKPSA